MTTRQQKLWTVALVATASLFLTTCRKDISVPNPDLEKLFGTWDWVGTYCGWSGASSPATVGYSQTVEFNKNGIYKMYHDGKQTDKRKFTLTEGSSIYTSGTAYLINYKDTKLFKKKNYTTQSVTFAGQDTLFLNDEAYDGCGDTYVKHK
jgi:hypothetical protein